MNKSELIEQMAKQAGISKAVAARALDAAIWSIKLRLTKGDTVSLIGFGSFKLGRRAARFGRNPRTGEDIRIRARRVVVFKAGKAFNEAAN